jgi:hypothetical protein
MRLMPTSVVLSLSAETSPLPQPPAEDVVEAPIREERIVRRDVRSAGRRGLRRHLLHPSADTGHEA